MKYLLILLLPLFSQVSYAQQYEITPDGLKDKSNAENTFLVLDIPSKTADEMYTKAIAYINENYKNPKEVIKGETENEFLKFRTHAPQFTQVKNGYINLDVSMNYTTELRFKDGKVRFDIVDVDITADNGGRSVDFSGNVMAGFPIFNEKNGKLKQADAKVAIENYFNKHAKDIQTYLISDSKKDDW